MEYKDLLLIIVAFLGWSWGIMQFILKRRHQRNDKRIDRKYVAYSKYMRKSDELMSKLRNDPKQIYGISQEFMKELLSPEEDNTNSALMKFNEKLIDYVKNATQPLLILKQELNSLLLVCSDELSIKISELIELTEDFNTEVQKHLSNISPNDSNSLIRELTTLSQNERWLIFNSLNDDIIKLMRKEIKAK